MDQFTYRLNGAKYRLNPGRDIDPF